MEEAAARVQVAGREDEMAVLMEVVEEAAVTVVVAKRLESALRD